MLKKPKGSRAAVLLIGLLVAAFFAARHLVPRDGAPSGDAPVYGAREAGEHVGEYARVCGTVVDAAYRPRIRGAPTFLNFEEPYPDRVFTVVIWRDVRARFQVAPDSAFLGRRICATGRIEEHEGRPQIVLDAPSRISAAEDTPAGRGPRPGEG